MEKEIIENKVVERFLSYVKKDTQSDFNTGLTPSTPGQMLFAKDLVEELKAIGLSGVSLDDNGYVMAHIPSNVTHEVPTIGFVAHMDTSSDFSGKHVKPQIIEEYNGEDIVLNAEKNIIMSTAVFNDLLKYKGQKLIVTDGTTLLGADDKAGVAEIITTLEYLVQHPEIKHGKVCIAFTPDEEIGQGADFFDVEKFGAEWAYTIDGGELGELEFENFNAAEATVVVKGVNVHPGYALNKMRNSIRIANQFVSMLPRYETPEHTTGYEGFYHLISMTGGVEETQLKYIIRDHDRHRFSMRKKEMQHIARKVNAEFGEGTVSIEINDQYYNMVEKIEPVKFIVDLAEESMREVGIDPIIKPVRGGTDGARLSFMGLPCPNIFGGGHNFHGKFEYIPTRSMRKSCELILKIVEKVSNIKKQ